MVYMRTAHRVGQATIAGHGDCVRCNTCAAVVGFAVIRSSRCTTVVPLSHPRAPPPGLGLACIGTHHSPDQITRAPVETAWRAPSDYDRRRCVRAPLAAALLVLQGAEKERPR